MHGWSDAWLEETDAKWGPAQEWGEVAAGRRESQRGREILGIEHTFCPSSEAGRW